MANPWFPFYVDDYERKTAHLAMLQHGAYGELIRRYYMVGGPLPANAEQFHRMCRATTDAERDALTYCLEQFFHLEADGWHHDRCDEELAKSREISEKRAKSAISRHSKCRANAPAIAEQMQTQLQPQPHKEKNRAKRASSFPEGYQPNQAHKDLAVSLGINLRESFPAFRDYHQSKGSTFKDWDAALRTWLRNEKKFSKQVPVKPPAQDNRPNDSWMTYDPNKPSVYGGSR